MGSSFTDNFPHVNLDNFRNEVKNINKTSGSRYCKEIKEFAVSLHYYSPTAYRFVQISLHLTFF